MKKSLILGICIGFFLVLSTVKAFGPPDHVYLADRFLKESDSRIANLCRNYRREFVAGAVAPDSTIAFYYVEGGKVYKLTHSWQYFKLMQDVSVTDAEHCYVYGTGLGHYVPDSFSHNFFIPDYIRDWQHPNWYWHPMIEGKITAALVDDNLGLLDETVHSLDVMFENPRLIDITQHGLGDNPPVDARPLLETYKGVLGSAWVDIYRPPGEGDVEENIMGKYIWPFFAKSVGFFASYDDAMPYWDKSIDLMDRMGNNMELYKTCGDYICPNSPHGFEALNKANEDIGPFTLIAFVVIVIVIIIVIAKRFIK